MCPNLESYSTIKRSLSHSDNRFVSSNGRAAGDIGGKKEQRAKAPRRIGIFHRQHSPRSVHKQCAMETAKIADSSLDIDTHHVSQQQTLSPPSPGLHRWGSLTSQDSYSYKATNSKFEHELRKCLGSDYEEEILLKSYSCALQKDILVHGRLYITQKWFCFYSNILGFETKTCISCMDVNAIRKHKTAKLIPNAIQIETGDKKYGFSSFYHRDKTYLVLITVWQNALTRDPLSIDSLRQELKTLKVTKEQEKIIMGRRSKSASFTSDGSVDLDASVASVADSTTPTPVHPVCHSSTDTITNPTEDSDLGDEGTTGHHYQSYHGTRQQSHTHNSSPSSSQSGSPSEEDSDESNSSRGGDFEDQDDEEEDRRDDIDSPQKKNGIKSVGMQRSPSLITLRSESPREGSMAEGVFRVGGRGGGSPNMFHHWKQTWSFSSAWRRVTLIKPVEVVRRPIRFVSMCNTSQLINFFISIAIIFMFVYMLTMFCHLSQVNPSLHPYLKFQPWCSLCSSSDYPTTTGSTHQQAVEQPSMLSRLLLPTTVDGNDHGSSASASSFRSPHPSVLPTT